MTHINPHTCTDFPSPRNVGSEKFITELTLDVRRTFALSSRFVRADRNRFVQITRSQCTGRHNRRRMDLRELLIDKSLGIRDTSWVDQIADRSCHVWWRFQALLLWLALLSAARELAS